ncbi:MAG: hypothetical protein DCF29_03835 [Alphaproteobacteria bacterium]|nr:MAG: hypothetical protein DCF29_03835 [Alphaproteobacteria bacterium]
MSARNPPEPGWVTVAAAAAALTRQGDTIDASNVSRYLARNPDVPQRKDGKFRYVDLAALTRHRSSSVFVADKRIAREIEPVPATRTAFAPAASYDVDDEGPASGGSALTAGKVELQQIELRRKRREEDVEAGRLIPIDDLRIVVSAMMGAYTAELARQEQALTAKLGAGAGAEIRKAIRAARTAATTRLIEAAKEQLHDTAASHVAGFGGAAAAAA